MWEHVDDAVKRLHDRNKELELKNRELYWMVCELIKRAGGEVTFRLTEVEAAIADRQLGDMYMSTEKSIVGNTIRVMVSGGED